ncbi:putative GntR family transcriptional regulator [Gordonia polyisoprenivorans NBRC 16320 = JCM 10675]|nr:putative GntR family transcriptional regulator [Gordonia polyisoprenivorans NBRC 16320 = JCM 10675]
MAEKKVNSTEGDPWERVAARLGTDLFLDLQPDPSTTARGRGAMRRRALADALRDAISDGRLPPGTMVPPYRSLAADLGLARGTVAAVYAELVAEGRLTARQGSGTRVAGGIHPQPAVWRHQRSPCPLQTTISLSGNRIRRCFRGRRGLPRHDVY